MSIIRLPQAQPINTTLTKLAFRRLFTQDELVALELAKIDDPNAAIEQRTMAAHLRVFDTLLSQADYVDLTDMSTIAGVHALEGWGLIGPGRAAEILGG